METNTIYPYNSKKDIKPNIFRSCLDLLNNGYTESGKYEIKPYLNATKIVYCDQDTERGGWTMFLRNAYGLVTFNKTWIEYKNGFGNVEYDFWLGNEFMYNVTTLYNTHSKAVDLYVTVADEDDKSYSAIYKNFAILSENTSYTLQVSDRFNGTLGDALYHHSNVKFSTKDKDDDYRPSQDCANKYGEYGWWYHHCYSAVLTYMVYDTANRRYRPAPCWYNTHYDYEKN